MKHAFLIIAHHEFNILSILVDLLDDPRNDIFIHIDKKVGSLPTIECKHSQLKFISDQNRIDVRWGDITQIEAEFALFESAKQNGPYQYYHMISGVHLPLLNQDEFHSFFNSFPKSQVFSPMPSDPSELERKGNKMNFGMKTFSKSRLSQILWRMGIKVQEILDLKINKDRTFIKASNWVSISEDAVDYLLNKKREILNRYKLSMCGDELFVPTELTYANKNWNLMYSERLLLHHVGNANSTVITSEDLELIDNSNFLFGRKFSSSDMDVVHHIQQKVKSNL